MIIEVLQDNTGSVCMILSLLHDYTLLLIFMIMKVTRLQHSIELKIYIIECIENDILLSKKEVTEWRD